jgi:hypothetical protein
MRHETCRLPAPSEVEGPAPPRAEAPEGLTLGAEASEVEGSLASPVRGAGEVEGAVEGMDGSAVMRSELQELGGNVIHQLTPERRFSFPVPALVAFGRFAETARASTEPHPGSGLSGPGGQPLY